MGFEGEMPIVRKVVAGEVSSETIGENCARKRMCLRKNLINRPQR